MSKEKTAAIEALTVKASINARNAHNLKRLSTRCAHSDGELCAFMFTLDGAKIYCDGHDRDCVGYILESES